MRASPLAWSSTPSLDRPGALEELRVVEQALAALGEAITVHDERGSVRVANPAALALLAGSTEDPPYADRVADVLAGGGAQRDVLVEHEAEGRRRWLRADLQPLVRAGAVTGVVCSFADVTEAEALRAFRVLSRQMRALFDCAHTAVCVKSTDGRYLHVSPAHAGELGREPDELRETPEADVLTGEQLEAERRADADVLARRESLQTDERAGDRLRRVVRVPLLDDHGEPFAIVRLSVDVTEAPHDGRGALALDRALRLQLDAVEQGILLVDGDLRVRSCNPAARRLLADMPGGLDGPEVVDGSAPGEPLGAVVRTAIARRVGFRGILARLAPPGRDERWLAADVLPPEHAGGIAVVSLRDVTAERRREEHLLRAAYRDELTGLGNRRLFDEALALALQRARRYDQSVAVCMLDVDGLKRVNDEHGHAAGDRVLRLVGRALRDELRGEDLSVRASRGVVSSRYGGDEFLLLFTDVGRDEDAAAAAHSAIDRALGALAREALDPPVSLSTGIAVFPRDGEHADALVSAADRRMYEHKARRRAGA